MEPYEAEATRHNTQRPSTGVQKSASDCIQPLFRVLCGYHAHQRRVASEDSAATSVQKHTALLPGSNSSVVLLRLVKHDPFFDVWPEVRIQV